MTDASLVRNIIFINSDGVIQPQDLYLHDLALKNTSVTEIIENADVHHANIKRLPRVEFNGVAFIFGENTTGVISQYPNHVAICNNGGWLLLRPEEIRRIYSDRLNRLFNYDIATSKWNFIDNYGRVTGFSFLNEMDSVIPIYTLLSYDPITLKVSALANSRSGGEYDLAADSDAVNPFSFPREDFTSVILYGITTEDVPLDQTSYAVEFGAVQIPVEYFAASTYSAGSLIHARIFSHSTVANLFTTLFTTSTSTINRTIASVSYTVKIVTIGHIVRIIRDSDNTVTHYSMAFRTKRTLT